MQELNIRGDFEKRLKAVLEGALAASPSILYIDENSITSLEQEK